jgi:hypothetical protein
MRPDGSDPQNLSQNPAHDYASQWEKVTPPRLHLPLTLGISALLTILGAASLYFVRARKAS